MVFLRDIFGKHGNTANKGMFDLKITVFLVFLIFLFAIPAQGRYSGGNGEPNTPYRIGTAGDLDDIANHPNDFIACFVMVNDINLEDYIGTQFNIIGNYSTRFAGVFDGNSNTIYNFTYNDPTRYCAGLFGYLDETAEVNNLGLEDVNIVGKALFGGLCGRNDGTISNCYVTGSITGGDYSESLGGLCGFNKGIISNCYATVSVTGEEALGSLCGDNRGTISNCYATGNVTGQLWEIGGLCGKNGGTISNCYATGNINGEEDSEYIGGLCGFNEGAISNCYATGIVMGGFGSDHIGGLCGRNNGGTISNCYYSIGYVTDGGGISKFLGGLCGSNDGTISNCYATGNVTGGSKYSRYLGGLCGSNYNSMISNGIISGCYATGDVSGEGDLGGLCGQNECGTISNCYATGDVSGKFNIGGLFGLNEGTISNCYATGSVNGNDYIGGLCGRNIRGIISDCHAIGSVTGKRYLGGLCGDNWGGSISNCYSTGSVIGGYHSENLGGLCGWNRGSTISNCYATGSVSGDYSDYLGGLIGYNDIGFYTRCFWNSDVNPDLNGIGNATDPNVIAATTTEMQTESTFTDAGWDFVGESDNGTENHWRMCVDDVYYPKLSLEFPMMDFLCPDGVDFIDYSYFANCWDVNDPNCDFDDSGCIDANDLILFGDDWLRKY